MSGQHRLVPSPDWILPVLVSVFLSGASLVPAAMPGVQAEETSATPLATAPPTQTSAAANVLTLDEAIARARLSNPDLIAARLQHAEDVAGIDVAKERPNPDVTFTETRETPRQTIGATLPIELGGKRNARASLAQATVAATDADIERQVRGVENDVRHAYFQAVFAQAHVTLTQDARALAVRARDAARTRAAAGDVAQSDVVQTELELADADDDVTDAQGDATAARADLNTLLGQPADTPITLADRLDGGTMPTLADVQARAAGDNADLALLDKQITAEQAKRAVARSAEVPDLVAGAGFTYDAQPDFRFGWQFSADMTVPLFTHHKAGVAVEDAELARLTAEREAKRLSIAGDVASAYARLSAARDRTTHFQTTTTPLTNDVERLAQNAYDAGERGLTDLLQALQQVRDIRLKGLQSSLDFQLALADLERAVGAPLR